MTTARPERVTGSDQQDEALLRTALKDVASSLSDALRKLIRAELKKEQGTASVSSAVREALPLLLERTFERELLHTEPRSRLSRVALLHVLTSAEMRGIAGAETSPIPDAPEVSEPGALTTEAASKLLGVSRTHLISLINSGALQASVTSGGHRRIPRAAVLHYKAQMKTRQSAGLDAMMDATTKLGLYEAESAELPARSRKR